MKLSNKWIHGDCLTELKKMEDELQKTTDKYIAEINSIYDAKEKEIMD